MLWKRSLWPLLSIHRITQVRRVMGDNFYRIKQNVSFFEDATSAFLMFEKRLQPKNIILEVSLKRLYFLLSCMYVLNGTVLIQKWRWKSMTVILFLNLNRATCDCLMTWPILWPVGSSEKLFLQLQLSTCFRRIEVWSLKSNQNGIISLVNGRIMQYINYSCATKKNRHRFHQLVVYPNPTRTKKPSCHTRISYTYTYLLNHSLLIGLGAGHESVMKCVSNSSREVMEYLHLDAWLPLWCPSTSEEYFWPLRFLASPSETTLLTKIFILIWVIRLLGSQSDDISLVVVIMVKIETWTGFKW